MEAPEIAAVSPARPSISRQCSMANGCAFCPAKLQHSFYIAVQHIRRYRQLVGKGADYGE